MVKTVDVLGFPHAYELSAPTDAPVVLVFVHGWLLSQAYWQPVINQLARDYQCLTYDLRGFGDSQAVPGSAAAIETRTSGTRSQAVSPNMPEQNGSEQNGSEQNGSEQNVPEAVLQKTAVSAARSAAWSGDASRTNFSVSLHLPNSESSPTDSSIASPSELAQTELTQTEFAQADAATDAAADRYTPAAYAQDLIHLLAQLQIKKAWVIGHSLGGSIALWAAHLAPETINGVICINSGGGIYLKEEFERFRLAGEQLVKFRPRWLSCLPFLDLLLTRMNVCRPIARRWAKQRLRDLLRAEAKAALGSLLDSTTEAEVHQLPQVVSQLQQPVHFVAGQKDTVMEPQYVRHLASFHSSFEFCGHNVSEIADCGHLAMIEQSEATAAEIRAILAKHS